MSQAFAYRRFATLELKQPHIAERELLSKRYHYQFAQFRHDEVRYQSLYYFAIAAPGHTSSLNRSTGSRAVQAMPRNSNTRNSGSSNVHE